MGTGAGRGVAVPGMRPLRGQRPRCVWGSTAAVSWAAWQWAGARAAGFPHLIPCNLVRPQDIQHTEKFLIKPESRVAQLNTSQWPLLLKVEPLQTPRGPSPAPPSLSAGLGRLQLLLCVTLLLRNHTCDAQSGGKAFACRNLVIKFVWQYHLHACFLSFPSLVKTPPDFS